MNFDKILVPVDFSFCSLDVARDTAGLAAKLGAELVLLHVSELPDGVRADTTVTHDGSPTAAATWMRADSRRHLAEMVALCAEAGVTPEVIAEVGPVVPTILAVIDRIGAGLVVMGTHGRTGLARLVLGSVAEGVAHQAHVPVMLVRRVPRASCGHTSCEWCASGGRSAAEAQVDAETTG